MSLKNKHPASRILATALAVAMLGSWPVLAFAEDAADTADATPSADSAVVVDDGTDQTDTTVDVTADSTADSVAVVESSAVDALAGCPPTHHGNTATVTLQKTLTLRENTYAPNTEFKFTIVPGGQGALGDQPVLPGIADAVMLDNNGEISFSPEDSKFKAATPFYNHPYTNMPTTFTKSLNMKIDTNQFDVVGIYHYILAETNTDYDGIVYDEVLRDVYIYITNNRYNQPTYTDTVVMKGDNKTVEFKNTYKTNNLTVKKILSGNQAVMSAAFTFNVGVNGADDEQYLIKRSDGKAFTLTSSATDTIPIELKNNQTFTIYGLSPDDTYTVTEAKANEDGYTTTFDGAKVNSITGKFADLSEDARKDLTVTCVNNRNALIPTGLATDMLPYAGMVLLAVGCGIYLLRRKHTDSEL